eukprot:scaffold7918_cov136-Isochrysis_galbana.AAC.2
MPVHPTNIPLAPMYPPDFTLAQTVVVHAALKPSLRKRRPEEGEGMGEEWKGYGKGEGECRVSGRHVTD